MATNYYRKYVEEGRCARCGAYLPKGFEYKECDPCRERENILARRRRRENSKKTTEPTKNGATLWKRSLAWQWSVEYITDRW